MKNLFHWHQNNEAKFIWNEIPGGPDETMEGPKEASDEVAALQQSVDALLQAYPELSEESKASLKEAINTLAGPEGDIDAQELSQIETHLEEVLGAADVDISMTETETTRTEEIPGLEDTDNEKYLNLTTPFQDEVSNFMTQNEKYYLGGDGTVVIDGQITDTLPEGVEQNQLAGKERVMHDFQNLDVSSAEELYNIVQASYQQENPGITNPSFTMEDAQNIFNYRSEGKSVNGTGEYNLDAINAEGEPISTEVKELQAILARANAALEGNLMENSVAEAGADGQDGYATINARRRFAAAVNKAKLDMAPKTEEVKEVIHSAEIKVGIETLITEKGRTLFLEDRSGTMTNDVKRVRGTVANIAENLEDSDFAFKKIGGGDQERGFQTAIEEISNVFDKEASGNKIIMYSDELQRSDNKELDQFLQTCQEYNVDATLFFIDPSQPGVMKQINMTDMTSKELRDLTKDTPGAGQIDQDAYDNLPGEAMEMKGEEVNPEFNSLLARVDDAEKWIDRAENASSQTLFNSFVGSINVAMNQISQNASSPKMKAAMLKRFESSLSALSESEYGQNSQALSRAQQAYENLVK